MSESSENRHYSPDDLDENLEQFDSYLGKQRGYGMFEADEPLRAGLIGSGYIVGQGKSYDIKDLDLYFPHSEVFDQIRRCPGISQANTSIHVLHVHPREHGGRAPTIELFRSISQPLDFPHLKGHEVSSMLDEELDEPEDFAYQGDNLEVVLPDPEVYAATKSPETENVEKYLEQFETLDELLGTDLAENHHLQT
jgi:hypothetical protein